MSPPSKIIITSVRSLKLEVDYGEEIKSRSIDDSETKEEESAKKKIKEEVATAESPLQDANHITGITSSCEGCALSLYDLHVITDDPERCFKFCEEHGLIRASTRCLCCGTELTRRKGHFRCDRTQRIRKKKHVKIVRCRTKISHLRGTLFQQSRLSIRDILRLVYHFLLPGMTVQETSEQVGIGKTSVIEWNTIFREVTSDYCFRNAARLGGPGKIIEIDEKMFFGRKEEDDHLTKGQWVLGGVERGSKKFFMVAVKDRSEESLIPLILERILPGTTIISDSWKSYDCLKNLGYDHRTSSRTQHSTDPESGSGGSGTHHIGTGTQHIMRAWRDIKNLVPKFGKNVNKYDAYISAAVFIRQFPSTKERFHQFLLVAARLYPPKY